MNEDDYYITSLTETHNVFNAFTWRASDAFLESDDMSAYDLESTAVVSARS